ncbi:type-F conjugative transfer system pilin assembly protein TrbC [Fluviicoccus keumensis]|uniref:Type-F conjugative transfer system pilin assembly protein TrbC n=1 Tax=Fluviicoccus keumensis TaxID=1435465 RepID=A0A4Q7YIZ3_9GAMM|nr:type-F conjugative transfer system pilin assembly protein TrbC [Fluviicoccus keumensis]RZU36733.1 type-F conjugative transfer system pilin assembly protein TrbC [Fluviicoccus keumensis]
MTLAVLGVASGPLMAADRPEDFPTLTALEQKQRELQPIIRRDLQQSPSAAQSIDEAYLRTAFPKIEISPAISDTQHAGIDIDRWVDTFENADAVRVRNEAVVLLFVSASIPEKTLTNLLEQARDRNIKVVFRGVTGDNPLSFSHFRRFLTGLGLNRYPEIDINPVAFERFQVREVPALIVSLPSEGAEDSGCQVVGRSAIVYGDVPVQFSLERIVSEGEPELAAVAKGYLIKGSQP